MIRQFGLRNDQPAPPPTESVPGDQGITDTKQYRAWFKVDEKDAKAGKYLVDESGAPVYFVDPGINGTHKATEGGREVEKFGAPKATLMSYIIKGILSRQLPWGLVLFGVMIAVVLEMSGVSSLAFAVGVYLPLSSSTPIFVGGLVRWLVDRKRRKELAHIELTEEQLAAEGDKSSGVLMASGYIAGGAIAGIIIAFMAGVLGKVDRSLTDWANAHNPFFGGTSADLLSMIPFLALSVLLYLVGREILLGMKKPPSTARPR